MWSLHQKLAAAKDSEVKGKHLQLGRIYHRRRTLRKMKTAGKATGNNASKYVALYLDMTWYKTK